MRCYQIDLATGAVAQVGPGPAIGTATDDAYFIDPTALADPPVRRALGDIYAAIGGSRRFVPPAQPAKKETGHEDC